MTLRCLKLFLKRIVKKRNAKIFNILFQCSEFAVLVKFLSVHAQQSRGKRREEVQKRERKRARAKTRFDPSC
jgi:hypothetical protein